MGLGHSKAATKMLFVHLDVLKKKTFATIICALPAKTFGFTKIVSINIADIFFFFFFLEPAFITCHKQKKKSVEKCMFYSVLH